MTTDAPRRRWRLYETPNGMPVVREEIRDLGQVPAQLVTSLMKRHLRGESLPREDRALGVDGLRELRVFNGNDPYRLIYVYEGRRIALGLRAIFKNQQRLGAAEMRLVRERLSSWRGRGEGQP